MSLGDVFSRIYRDKTWFDTCGSGSTREYTAQLIPKLQDIIERYGVKTFLDAPCGLYRWIDGIKVDTYIGADIVHEIIAENVRNVSHIPKINLTFRYLDITSDVLPTADLLHCRACLFHLSEENIVKALKNWQKSDIPLALFTTNDEHSKDCLDGEHRPLDITKYLGEPLELFDDGPLLKMGLWRRSSGIAWHAL